MNLCPDKFCQQIVAALIYFISSLSNLYLKKQKKKTKPTVSYNMKLSSHYAHSCDLKAINGSKPTPPPPGEN